MKTRVAEESGELSETFAEVLFSMMRSCSCV
jgi:hypothetical protein